MKKYLYLLIYSLMICILITGCTDYNKTTEKNPQPSIQTKDLKPTTFDEVNQLDDVIMTVKGETSTGLTVLLQNKSNSECIFGEYFYLERKQDGNWYKVPVTIKEDYGFEDIAYILPPHEETEWEVDWNWLYGSLESGEYRIIKDVHELTESGYYDAYYLACEFMI